MTKEFRIAQYVRTSSAGKLFTRHSLQERVAPTPLDVLNKVVPDMWVDVPVAEVEEEEKPDLRTTDNIQNLKAIVKVTATAASAARKEHDEALIAHDIAVESYIRGFKS